MGPPFVQHGARIRYPVDDLKQWAASLPRFTSIAQGSSPTPHGPRALPQRATTAHRPQGEDREARREARKPKNASSIAPTLNPHRATREIRRD